MQRDYKIGLVVGLVAGGVAMIWVATRPSLGPEARMLQSSRATSRDSGVGLADRDSGRISGDSAATPAPSLGSLIDSRLENRGQKAQGRDAAAGPVTQIPAPAANPQSAGVPDLTIYEKAEKIKTTRFHIVRKNETLSAISQQYYGDRNKWQKITQANKNVIKDPNKLQPGTKLIIPD
jgi:nucleoid-associated protein YgaU